MNQDMQNLVQQCVQMELTVDKVIKEAQQLMDDVKNEKQKEMDAIRQKIQEKVDSIKKEQDNKVEATKNQFLLKVNQIQENYDSLKHQYDIASKIVSEMKKEIGSLQCKHNEVTKINSQLNISKERLVEQVEALSSVEKSNKNLEKQIQILKALRDEEELKKKCENNKIIKTILGCTAAVEQMKRNHCKNMSDLQFSLEHKFRETALLRGELLRYQSQLKAAKRNQQQQQQLICNLKQKLKGSVPQDRIPLISMVYQNNQLSSTCSTSFSNPSM